jgi:hypothetical protein
MSAMSDPHERALPQAIVLNRDLLFGSRIRTALRSLGIEPVFAHDTSQFVAALDEAGERAAIGIIDMNGAVDWPLLAERLAGRSAWPPTLGFGPHTDAASRRAAKAAGLTRVVSNGKFHAEVAALIERYRAK